MLSPAPLQDRLQVQRECLGPKVAVVAGKLDPTVSQTCFCRIFAGNVSLDQNPFGLKTGQNDPVRGPQVLGNFSRVLELKMSVLGLGFYLARKTRFI